MPPHKTKGKQTEGGCLGKPSFRYNGQPQNPGGGVPRKSQTAAKPDGLGRWDNLSNGQAGSNQNCSEGKLSKLFTMVLPPILWLSPIDYLELNLSLCTGL